MFSEMAGPSVMVCSENLLFSTHFSGSVRAVGFRAFAGLWPSVLWHSLFLYTIATPVSVGNPNAPCGVETDMLKLAIVSCPSSTSWLEVEGMTRKSNTSVRPRVRAVCQCDGKRNIADRLYGSVYETRYGSVDGLQACFVVVIKLVEALLKHDV